MALTGMVFDRTQADVDALKAILTKIYSGGYNSLSAAEKTSIESTSNKGAYNYTDWNRVRSAISQVASDLAAAGYPVTLVGTIATKNASGYPSASEAAVYLDQVDTIRNALAVFDTTPTTPSSLDNLDYEKANDIERILYDVSVAIDNLLAAMFYSGEVYSGEVQA